MAKAKAAKANVEYSETVATISYILSRVDFVLAHIVFAVWVIFITNDPLNFREYASFLNTMDVDAADIDEDGVIDYAAMKHNIKVFLLFWWLPHSALSRNVVKKALGLGPQHPLDRPIFSFIAPFSWYSTMYLWQPISAASRLDVTTITLKQYFWRAPIILTGLVETLGLFYLLPNHVFGTDRHEWARGNMPKEHKLIVKFPYNLVRHPAAACFLWVYWIGIPSYNANHILLASMWTVFIFVGTLLFEEGGLRDHEFKQKYVDYSKKIYAFYPSMYAIKHNLGLLREEEKWKDEDLIAPHENEAETNHTKAQ